MAEKEYVKITLRAARVNAGLTQCQVMQALGYARSTLKAWETGERSPKLQDLKRLCALYSVSTEQIEA